MRFRLMMVFALALSACGGSGSSTEPEAVSAPVVDASEACPDAVDAAPERLPVGEVQELPDNGRDHVICASYERTPPASGAHFPAWQNCGVYARPIQNQTAVHSLEHGAVWAAYQPGLDASVLQAMTDQLKSERFALAAPYPGLQNPIVLTAWTRQLAVDEWSDPAVGDFLDTYLGRYSPVAPEAGASCGQAVGSAPDAPNLHYQEILEQVS
ncbi:MAG: DUF3105 domain-containing protein [Acidimicrobiaceae bacterium]|nr:DUF3105 domain-containing protein [Acidimicrobiaceae bacterium]